MTVGALIKQLSKMPEKDTVVITSEAFPESTFKVGKVGEGRYKPAESELTETGGRACVVIRTEA